MSEYFESRIASLKPEDAFRIMFGAYEFLRDLSESPGSGPYDLLKKISEGDPETIINCYVKMREEQDETHHAIAGTHLDEGYTQRENVINEAEQSIYWSGLVVVGRRAEYNAVELPRFIYMGFEGAYPIDVPKAEWKSGVEGSPTEKTVVAFRRSLVTAGRYLHDFNERWGSELGSIEPRDLAVWDLRQMAERKYLQPFLVEKGLLEKS